jgi:glycosyltransferase involved in cell wall biosynthesis
VTAVPVVVLDVDAEAPVTAIPGYDPDGRRTERAWLLVRAWTEPLGYLTLPVPEAGLPADVVRAAVVERFGDEIGRRSPGEFARRRAELLADAPRITVVVCTRDRPGQLARTLESLLALEYPRDRLRILVVDNASRDGTTRDVVRAAASRGPVEYLWEPVPGLSRARNAAVAAKPGDALAWIDDDEVADRYWLAELARALVDHPEADVVCGAIVPAELKTAAQVWFEEFGGLVKGRGFTPAVFHGPSMTAQSPLFPLPPFGAGANMLTRPGVLERIGGFDPALGAGTATGGGEDTLAFGQILRRGGTIVYRPAALVRHFHRTDVDGLRRQLIGYGTGLTAGYVSWIRRDPRVLAGLVRLAPRALREVLGGSGARTATLGPDFPVELLRANRRGMLAGPVAYLRSRREVSRS